MLVELAKGSMKRKYNRFRELVFAEAEESLRLELGGVRIYLKSLEDDKLNEKI